MFTKRKVLYVSSIVVISFIICTYSLMNKLNNIGSEVKLSKEQLVQYEIIRNVDNLPIAYKTKHVQYDNISSSFIRNTKIVDEGANINKIWEEANNWVTGKQLYDPGNSNIGNVLHALKNTQIIAADVDTRGTQLKLLLTLSGGQQAVFKPKWYERDKIIEGAVYSGKDRYGAEILAFFLSAILDFRTTPIAVERVINLQKEILPVATKRLSSTIDIRKNISCVYGICFYCKREDPVCEKDGGLKGALLFQIPKKFKTYKSPWQRTYKKGKKAQWEVQSDYCRTVKMQLSKHRLLDLIDVSIFDFLLQNGDRHHYETLKDHVLLLDNGKGLGNPNVHHVDILAPLYQCCILRPTTWARLLSLSGGLLGEILNTIPNIEELVSTAHLNAIEERLLIIYSAVERCRKRDKILNSLF